MTHKTARTIYGLYREQANTCLREMTTCMEWIPKWYSVYDNPVQAQREAINYAWWSARFDRLLDDLEKAKGDLLEAEAAP